MGLVKSENSVSRKRYGEAMGYSTFCARCRKGSCWWSSEVADGICDNMMRHLLTNAFVAGMDTTAFEEHAKTFWEIRSALGSETTATGAVAYAQGVLGQGAGLSIPVPDGMALL